MLGEHGGREAPGEHREHGGQHGGVNTVVTGRQAAGQAGRGLGQVLGQGSHSGPGDGGQLEQVLRERVVVVRHAGEEWQVGDQRNGE